MEPRSCFKGFIWSAMFLIGIGTVFTQSESKPDLLGAIQGLQGTIENASAVFKRLKGSLEAHASVLRKVSIGANVFNLNLRPRPSELPETTNGTEILEGTEGTLYSGIYFSGTPERYNLTVSKEGPAGCYKFSLSSLKSIDTSGHCVRLFDIHDCAGHSVAVYPGSGLGQDLTFFRAFTSLGPCLPNEFEFSTLSRTLAGALQVRKDTLNAHQVPDLIHFTGPWSWEEMVRPSEYPSQSILAYFKENHRVQYILGELRASHLLRNPPVSDMNQSGWWGSVEKHGGDDLGFFIPLGLGGAPNKLYNVFPQSRGNKEGWVRATEEIKPYLARLAVASTSDSVWMHITPTYEGNSSRTHGFYYRFNLNAQKIVYGFLRN